MTGSIALQVRHVSKSYGDVMALEPTDFEMQRGEFVTLLGPSGSGKTTLLMAIAGLSSPDDGEIWINGENATELPPFRRGIGMVFQNYALFPHLTIFENVAFPLQMRKVNNTDIRQRVSKVLETVQLSHMADRLPRELSGGQQQRIALARCFVYDPSIILMDEPLGALDKKLREVLQLEIRRLHSDLGATILYVTHDQEEAMVMSDRICLMNNARIEQIDSPYDLYFSPRSAFTAEFLGDSNLFEGTLTQRQGDFGRATLSDGTVAIARVRVDQKEGSTVKVLVRPENIRLLASHEPMRENAMHGVVKDCLITGTTTKLLLQTAVHEVAKVTLLTNTAHALPRKGEHVLIGWDAAKSVLVSCDTGAAR